MSKDLFSQQSDLYARYRPGYPAELFEYILRYVPDRHAAWDCATGTGQAAQVLANEFKIVHATDISSKQIENALPAANIHYSVGSADKTTFRDQSLDLVTVAQAYHWFDFESFALEVHRVLKKEGIIAIWGYSLVTSENQNIDGIIQSFYTGTVGPYWDAERKYVDEQYRTVPFPYEELPSNTFSIQKEWTLEDLAGYINTWSSVQHFIKARAFNPVDELVTALRNSWPEKELVNFTFPLFLRLGRRLQT